jgi:hypothetical protein
MYQMPFMPNPSGQGLTPENTGAGVRFIGIALAIGAVVILTLLCLVHFVFLEGESFVTELDLAPHVSVFGVLVAGVGLLCQLLSAWIPNATVTAGVKKLAAKPPEVARNELYAVWSGTKLIQFGLAEGPLVIAILFFLIAADYLALGVAVVLLFVLLLRIPAANEVETFVEEQSAELEEIRRTAIT